MMPTLVNCKGRLHTIYFNNVICYLRALNESYLLGYETNRYSLCDDWYDDFKTHFDPYSELFRIATRGNYGFLENFVSDDVLKEIIKSGYDNSKHFNNLVIYFN